MQVKIWNYKLATLVAVLALFAIPALAWPPGGNGGGGNGGSGGGGGSTQPTYTFAWLGTLGGLTSSPGGINNRGDIWGGGTLPSGDGAPFIIWATGPQAGQMQDFHQLLIDQGWIEEFDWTTLSGILDININDINDLGHVAFIAHEIVDLQADEHLYYTYLYKPETVNDGGTSLPASLQMVDVNTLPVYEVQLNNAGMVASVSTENPENGSVGSYQWNESTGPLYLSNSIYEPWSMNVSGSMCGQTWRYTPGVGYYSAFPADVVGPRRKARDINDSNQIAGIYQKSSTTYYYACRIEADGSIKVISMPKKLGSVGYAINEFGDVVGSGNLNGGWRPFVFTDTNGIIDVFGRTVNLPSEIATKIDGNGSSDDIGSLDINDAGQIVGSVRFFTNDGSYQLAFLLTPNP